MSLEQIKCTRCKNDMPKLRLDNYGYVAKKLQELENTSRGVRNVPLEILNYDEDEITDDAKALDAVIEKTLDDELEVEEVEEDLEDLEDVEDVDLEDEDDE